MELNKQSDAMFNFHMPAEKIKVETKKEKMQKKLNKMKDYLVKGKYYLFSLKTSKIVSFVIKNPIVCFPIVSFAILIAVIISTTNNNKVEQVKQEQHELVKTTQQINENNKQALLKIEAQQKEEKEKAAYIKDLNIQVSKLTEKDLERIAKFMKWHEDRDIDKAIKLYWTLVYVNEIENKGSIDMAVVHNTIKTFINKMHDHYSYRRSDMYSNYKEIKEGKLMNVRTTYDNQNMSQKTLNWLQFEKTKSTFYSEELNLLTQDKGWGGVVVHPEELVKYLEQKKSVIAKSKELFLD